MTTEPLKHGDHFLPDGQEQIDYAFRRAERFGIGTYSNMAALKSGADGSAVMFTTTAGLAGKVEAVLQPARPGEFSKQHVTFWEFCRRLEFTSHLVVHGRSLNVQKNGSVRAGCFDLSRDVILQVRDAMQRRVVVNARPVTFDDVKCIATFADATGTEWPVPYATVNRVVELSDKMAAGPKEATDMAPKMGIYTKLQVGHWTEANDAVREFLRGLPCRPEPGAFGVYSSATAEHPFVYLDSDKLVTGTRSPDGPIMGQNVTLTYITPNEWLIRAKNGIDVSR